MCPFTDLRVRRAFNYAVNKGKLIGVLNGRGGAAHGVMPPGLPGYNPRVQGYAYDPAKARQLLEESGVPRNFSPVLWRRSDPTEMMRAQSIQQYLALVRVHLVPKTAALP